METHYILIIVFGILTSLLIISLLFVNRILDKKRKIDLLFENVIKYVDERVAIMERIGNFVEENIEEEINLSNKINDCSTILNELVKKNEYNEKEISKSNKMLEKYSKLIDTYPYLSKNEIYKILVTEKEINTERINYALDIYNEKVKEYNKFKEKNKINTFISKIFRLSDYQCYKK